MATKTEFVRTCSSLLFVFLFNVGTTQGQPVSIKWFPAIKTDKDQRTLMLLNAGENGFHLLRWQNSRTDASGKQTPGMPILTTLTPAGERLHDDIIPGFENGTFDFRFAIPGDSVLLVVYEAPNSTGTQTLFARRLNMERRSWSAEARVLFTDVSGRAPAFASAWFSRSADGRSSCIYHAQSGSNCRIAAAVFDEHLNLVWQRTSELPPTSGQMALREVVCTNSSAILIYGQIFNPGGKITGSPYETSPSVFLPNGRPVYRADEWAAAAIPYTDAIFLIDQDKGTLSDFYLQLGKKFTPAFEIAERSDGKIFCTGFYSDIDNDQVEGYFVYTIDPESKKGELLKNIPLPGSLRKAFLSNKASAKKEPVKGLTLRWLRWAADGRPWILAERQNFGVGQSRMEAAVLLRLDSTFRINNTRAIEKFQRITTGDPQNFASLAACPDQKNGWWLWWNSGAWPNAKIMLTACHSNAEPTEYTIDSSSHSNVSLLPQTFLKRKNIWYFVGESEYHERFRVGMLVE